MLRTMHGLAQSEPLEGIVGSGGFGWLLLKTLLLLAAVCLFAYVVIRLLVRRLSGLQGGASNGGARLAVIDRLVLEPRRSVQVVRAGSKTLLIGVSEGQISLIDELDPSDWPSDPDDNSRKVVRGAFKKTLSDLLSRNAEQSNSEKSSEDEDIEDRTS